MKLLLYCTKSKPYLVDLRKYPQYIKNCGLSDIKTEWTNLNGKIVGECDFEVEEMKYHFGYYNMGDWFEILGNACLTNNELDDYLQGENGYAIHIKNLKIFDEPKELNCFRKKYKDYYFELTKAPQNMMKIWFVDDIGWVLDYVLISIRPEWLCKILNGEKTIEVRKKVLKEMTENEKIHKN